MGFLTPPLSVPNPHNPTSFGQNLANPLPHSADVICEWPLTQVSSIWYGRVWYRWKWWTRFSKFTFRPSDCLRSRKSQLGSTYMSLNFFSHGHSPNDPLTLETAQVMWGQKLTLCNYHKHTMRLFELFVPVKDIQQDDLHRERNSEPSSDGIHLLHNCRQVILSPKLSE